ncbi:MAG TPA: pyridoxal-phosphate dependent enzyme [Solirubrobacteraceae bacterium]|jgi:diaminopropionate ammonia-lyase|nr:pyridoxal-phosphate dependent enzyme [Solirubrobacteraceae bacterium]
MRAILNRNLRPDAVAPPATEPVSFHAGLPGYHPTPLRDLSDVAEELGVGTVALKDESRRLGLPAFKILGASWAVERSLRQHPDGHTLLAGSAGNHGRAIAHLAAQRGLRCRIFLPSSASPARREAILGEGAEVVVVDGGFDAAISLAATEAQQEGQIEIADAGTSQAAHWVIDGYSTLFNEVRSQQAFDLVLVPVGVGALAAAAARFAAGTSAKVIGVEPAAAACLTASLAAGTPVSVATPGTTMACLDCGSLSLAAWDSLRNGLHGTITVTDLEVHASMRELAAAGFAIGDCGAASLAALRALVSSPACAALREMVALGRTSRVLLLATEGSTDPAAYNAIVGTEWHEAKREVAQPAQSALVSRSHGGI